MSFGIDINAKQVTQEELAKLLIDLDKKGTVPVSFTLVNKKSTKVHPTFTRLELPGYSGKGGLTNFVKVSQVSGMMGLDYETKVNREREKAGLTGDFEAGKSPYEYLTDGVRKKGSQYYLFYYPQSEAKDFEPVVLGDDGDGLRIVEESEYADYLPKPRPETPGKQELPTDKQVRPNSVSLASIAAMRVDGQSYVLRDIDDLRLEAFEHALS
jgi:hypothetical protein